MEGAAAELERIVTTLPRGMGERWGTVARLRFGNAVGHIPAGPLGTLYVRSAKWAEDDYDGMLAEVAAEASALPFAAGAGSALPYARDSRLSTPDLPYHAFVWLRHVVLEAPNRPLLGALRAIVADPHRRLLREVREVPVELASVLSAGTLDDVMAGRWPLQRAPRGMGIAGHLPTRVTDEHVRFSVDTPENRFVKDFLQACAGCVAAMRRHVSTGAFAARVAMDSLAIEEALAPIRRAPLWTEVGRMGMVPSASTVLQRRAPYRVILGASQMLHAPSRALPLGSVAVQALLEVKDVARLYELWCAFQVIGCVRARLGAPADAEAVVNSPLSARVPYGLRARWRNGVEVAYNPEYTTDHGWHGRSRSLRVRPDVAVFVPGGNWPGLHLFDAKFRVSEGEPLVDDLHKMHAYRDAVPAARGAWVLFPGETARQFRDAPEAPLGIGALPLVPGREPTALGALLGELLAEA
ncbi:MAG: DUF2357 domain-containing protein [Pseudomonadota bacterium]|nr:DUF2357 domain-containing protein [Pseudomonadota bacterium]